jgi:hypothetical protein
MAARRISDEQVDRAIELLRFGIHPRAAANAAGMSLGTLYKCLHRRGLTAEGSPGRAHDRRRPPTERLEAQRARRDAVFAMHEAGLDFVEIGAELGVTRAGAHYLWRAALRERDMAAHPRQG